MRFCARPADSTPFNLSIFAVILANAAVLGLETYKGVVARLRRRAATLNDVFLGIFVVELAIRLTAFGSKPGGFFRSGWNVFDLLVVFASFAPGLRENAMLLRLARLARVLRIVRLLPDLRVLTIAIGRSIPGVASLAVLAVLVLFIYGMVGWTIFDDHKPRQYGTITKSMLTLFVTLTLENLPEQIELGPRAVGLDAHLLHQLRAHRGVSDLQHPHRGRDQLARGGAGDRARARARRPHRARRPGRAGARGAHRRDATSARRARGRPQARALTSHEAASLPFWLESLPMV